MKFMPVLIQRLNINREIGDHIPQIYQLIWIYTQMAELIFSYDKIFQSIVLLLHHFV